MKSVCDEKSSLSVSWIPPQVKSVCHEKLSLPVSWNPPSVTRSVCHQNIMIQTVILNPDDRWPMTTLLPAVHFLEQAFAGADFSTEKFSAALSLISAALFQCPKIAKFSVAHFFKLSCDLRCSFSIAKSRKILRCSSSDI